ncbi:MAG: LacI family DNA-binding transcriptional regulator [Clostridiaceae bacterium]
MKPTIKDVAKKANVSVATVSRILNNLPGYSETTKIKVDKIIKELDYHPNSIARGLANKNIKTIAILLPEVSTTFFSEIYKGMEKMAYTQGYSLLICSTGINGIKTEEYISILKQRQIDGVIITSSPITEKDYNSIKTLDIPCILIATMSYKYQFPYVKINDTHAAYAATEYLIKKGHKKIAMISGNKDDFISGTTRVLGFKRAHIDYNIKLDESLIEYGDFSFDSGILAMDNLLMTKKNEFTAVFAASDDMAIGALNSAYNNNIKIPTDLSIIGYDNTQLAKMSIPPLTTIAQPFFEMGYKSVEKLINMIESKVVEESIILPHSIIKRNSVRNIT